MQVQPQELQPCHFSDTIAALRRVLGHVWQAAPFHVCGILVLPFVQAVVPVVQISVTAKLIDSVAAVLTTNSAAFNGTIGLLTLQFGLNVMAALLRGLDGVVRKRLDQKTGYHLNRLVSLKSTRLAVTVFDSSRGMDFLHRASMGQGQYGIALIVNMIGIVQNAITLVSYMLLLAKVDWRLALALSALLLPTYLSHAYIGRRQYALLYQQTPNSRWATYLNNLLRSREAAKEVRLLNLTDHLLGRWTTAYWKNADEQYSLEKESLLLRLGTEGLVLLTGSFTVGLLIWTGAMNGLTLGLYVAMAQTVWSAQGLVQAMAGGLASLSSNTLPLMDMFRFLDTPVQGETEGGKEIAWPLRHGIKVEGLTFAYAMSRMPVLKNLSFEIKPGERIAIVGENGAGKTTLIKCLLGLYNPQAGQISYDGVDVNALNPHSLRQQVAVVFQDFLRFQMSLRENISLGCLERADDEEALLEAARKGAADEVAARLPKHYDTQLGVSFGGGQELSDGQWQKVALSRAFFRDASIVVLDEPTSALDPAAEAAIYERFHQLVQGKIALLISHRLRSCEKADRILVLKDGCIVEQGTHQELMAASGEYARMVRLQAKVSVQVPVEYATAVG